MHRTLIYGGWAGNPRSHLRLVYEGAPLAFLMANAGGRVRVPPTCVHNRTGRQKHLAFLMANAGGRVRIHVARRQDCGRE